MIVQTIRMRAFRSVYFFLVSDVRLNKTDTVGLNELSSGISRYRLYGFFFGSGSIVPVLNYFVKKS